MEPHDIEIFDGLLVYRAGYSREFVRDAIRANGLRGLRIFAQLPSRRLPDLSFLASFDFLRALWIASADDSDFGFLHNLTGLKELSLHVEGTNPIDLSNLASVESLDLKWRDCVRGLDQCKGLKELALIEFGRPDLEAIRTLTGLTRLVVKMSTIVTANGVDSLRNLESVVLGACKRLRSIDALGRCTGLKELPLNLCPKIGNLAPLAGLRALENLELIDCGSIDSLGFLRELASLKSLSILENTIIADGDLTPAQHVPDVFYRHRRSYNIKLDTRKQDALVEENLRKIREFFG